MEKLHDVEGRLHVVPRGGAEASRRRDRDEIVGRGGTRARLDEGLDDVELALDPELHHETCLGGPIDLALQDGAGAVGEGRRPTEVEVRRHVREPPIPREDAQRGRVGNGHALVLCRCHLSQVAEPARGVPLVPRHELGQVLDRHALGLGAPGNVDEGGEDVLDALGRQVGRHISVARVNSKDCVHRMSSQKRQSPVGRNLPGFCPSVSCRTPPACAPLGPDPPTGRRNPRCSSDCLGHCARSSVSARSVRFALRHSALPALRHPGRRFASSSISGWATLWASGIPLSQGWATMVSSLSAMLNQHPLFSAFCTTSL